MSTIRHIALLRGINVGGHKKIKMADLRAMFAGLGHSNVKTALASGNVAWDTTNTDPADMRQAIEQKIETTFGFTARVIVFPQAQVQQLVASDPFAGIEVTKDTRLYVTFLPEPPTVTLELPFHAQEGNFTILRVTAADVCSVLTLTAKARSVDSMKVLEQKFGKNVTTRNWNTVVKIASL